MKAKNILLISAILLAVIFIAPVKVYMQGKLNVKLNFVEQETRELAKMQKMKVKIRTTFSKLVLAGNVDPLKVEEAHFNEKGQLTEKLSFNTQGLLFRYLFTYNAQGLQTKKVTYDSNNKIIETETTKFDKKGNVLEAMLEQIVKGTRQISKKILSYDKQGKLAKTQIILEGKHTYDEIYEFKGGFMLWKKLVDLKGNPVNTEFYNYDDQNRKVQETDYTYSVGQKRDSTSGKLVDDIMEAKFEYFLKYDSKGNLIEEKAPSYLQIFKFNDNGDFIRDTIYDPIKHTRMNDNEFQYEDNGLLTQVIRYYSDGSPGAFITYTYEYYK